MASIFKKTLGDLAADRGLDEGLLLSEVSALHGRLPKDKDGKSFASSGQLAMLVGGWLTGDLLAFVSEFTDALVKEVGPEHDKGAVVGIGVDQEGNKINASASA